MKKKLINYAIDIMTSIPEEKSFLMPPRQYMKDLRYFVTDSMRIIELETDLPLIPVDTESDIANKCIQFMNNVVSKDLDYYIHELPTVEEIKQGIRETVGRKFDWVAWSDGYITLNARYLYKTMYALNAKVCYVSQTKPRTSAIFFCENDNPQSMNRAIVLPVYNRHERKGFWTSGRVIA